MVITRAVVIVALIDVTFVVGAEAFATSFVPVIGDLELGVVTVDDAALLFAEDEVLAGAAPVFEPSPIVAATSQIVGSNSSNICSHCHTQQTRKCTTARQGPQWQHAVHCNTSNSSNICSHCNMHTSRSA